jgi:PAS domain S-box-containing protein
LSRADFEHRLLRSDGEVRYIHQIAELVRDEQGRPLRESGVIQDITERERAAEALRLSEQRYRLMFEHNPSPMWVFDRETLAFLAVSDAAIALYGYTREEFLRMSVLEIRPPESVPDFLQRAAMAPDEFRAAGRFQHRKKDGTIFPVDIFVHGIDFAGRRARFALAIDMTVAERMVADLRASEARFRSLSESAPLGIYECDAAGLVTYYNPALIALTGRPVEESLGRAWGNNLHPDEQAAMTAGWARTVAAGGTWNAEQRLIRPDGSLRWVHTMAVPTRNAGGRITGFAGTVEDITERRMADVAVLESEERYRKLMMLSPDANLVHVDGIITLVNPAFCQMVGATDPAQLLGRPAVELVHPDDRARAHEWKLKLLAGQQVPRSELRFVRLDGTTVEVEGVGMVFDFRGRKEIQVIGRDITERKRAEESLRLLSSAVEQATESILITDAQLNFPGPKIIFVNPAFTRMTGYTAEEALGKTPRILQGPRTDRAVLDRLRQTLARGETFEGQSINYRKDGREYDQEWQIAPLRGADGIVTHFVAIQRDITASKAADHALRESEERFKLVARAVSDVVWDWNLLNDHLWWSDGFATTFGYDPSEVEPDLKSWTERIHPKERTQVVDSIHHAIATGAESWSADYRFRRKDGRYAFVQDRGFIHRNAAGQALRMVGGMRDLTEQKEMEAQYLRAQRMESIGTLAGGIAHDLNNVLAPIMMSIELLRLDTADSARRNRILDTIQVSSRRGADLVKQVLSFSKGLDGERVTIRLRHLVDELQGIIRETFPRNIRSVANVSDQIWPVTGDPTQLHQVLLNLAVNARDAMPEGGTLSFTASNLTIDAHYAGMIPNAKAGPYVLLEVTDTGQGMSPEVRERIFEPFFTTKELGKGTGLGLATVHTIVRSHGGFLSVDSAVGRGTTFKIYLPADPTIKAVATASPLPPELPRGRDELVVVVDDESSIREITQRTLETFGYRVITARDGTEAVALYSQRMQEIALVLTDMMMPVMDGPTSIRILQRLNPAVKIIAASGFAAKEHVAKATSSGVHDFLAKPYTAETLLQLVRKVIDRPPRGP